MSNPIGVYIHVPFCRSKCPYCDFYSLPSTQDTMDAYVSAILKTTPRYSHALNRGVDTLYFGGGTPSQLVPSQLGSLLSAFTPYLTKNAEITMECNPADDLETLLPIAAAHGVNRISLGMQSAVEAQRTVLGRRAGIERVKQAVSICRGAGIKNLSLDVMLGIPGTTDRTLAATLQFIAQAEVNHISAYLLKVEPGTAFAARLKQLNLPEEDVVCDQYLTTVAELEKQGFLQYEVSNFAKAGFESRHNLKYWHCEEYLGLGPSAHSYLDGRRFYYERDMDKFLNQMPPIDDGPGGDAEERLLLALRLKEGVPCSAFSETAIQKAQLYLRKGLLEQQNGRFSFTPEGFLISNTLISELLYD